jgi:hypothetical protein
MPALIDDDVLGLFAARGMTRRRSPPLCASTWEALPTASVL